MAPGKLTRKNVKKHAKYSPSTSDRWLKCPASARDDLPDRPPNEASLRGDDLHEWAKEGLRDGTAVPPEIGGYVNFVLDASMGGVLVIEREMFSLSIPDLFGTPDAFIEDKFHFHIVDLKTGKRPVKAWNNAQLKTYHVIARENYGSRDEYHGTIHQNGRPDTFPFFNDSLDKHEQMIHWAVANPEVYVAGNHCIWCPLREFKMCQLGMDYASKKGWPSK